MAKVGPPTKKTVEVIKQLEEVAALDGTVEEMAFYAGVHRDTVYLWLKEDDVLSDRIRELRQRPVLKARQTVNAKMGESYANAVDYLKRKKKDEFGDSHDITTKGEAVTTTPEILAKLDAIEQQLKKEMSDA